MKRLIIVGIIIFFIDCILFIPASAYANGNGWSFLAGLFTGGCLSLGLEVKDPYKMEPSQYLKEKTYIRPYIRPYIRDSRHCRKVCVSKRRLRNGRWHCDEWVTKCQREIWYYKNDH